MGQQSDHFEISLPMTTGDPRLRPRCIAIRAGSECQNDVPRDSRSIASVELFLSQNFSPPSFSTRLLKRLLCPECRKYVCTRRAATRRLGQKPVSPPIHVHDKSAYAIYRDDQDWLCSIFDQMTTSHTRRSDKPRGCSSLEV